MADRLVAPSRRVRRVLNAPLLLIAVVVVLVDDVFRAFVVPAMHALARLGLIRRIEAGIAKLPPTGILMLFLIPLAIIEPFKVYALYLFGQGRFLSGVLMFVLAKVVGLGLAERLFAIGRDKLLSIRWFAWCHARVLLIRDQVHAWLARTRFWPQAIRIVGFVRRKATALRHGVARLLHLRSKGRLAAARRRVRHYRAI
ncbi:hypothetical protein [Microvirga sp. G4-2]|uniref:hypothetical protein n=1 Tax=Microvirga sp. G4-2 TaxID=3434467 RepID=UPI004043A421